MFKDCYAIYDESTGYIKLDNSKIEKILQVKVAAVLQRLGIGNRKIFGAHGAPKEYSVN